MKVTHCPLLSGCRSTGLILFFLALPVLMLAEKSQAQCSTAPVEIISSSATTNKCGWPEWPCQVSCPPKYYLMSTYAASASSTYVYVNGGPSLGWLVGIDPYNYNEIDVSTMDRQSRSPTTVYSGTAAYIANGYTNGVFSGLWIQENGSITNSSTGEWDAGGGNAIFDGSEDLDSEYYLYSQGECQIMITTNCTSTTYGTVASGSYAGDPDYENQSAFTLVSTSLTGLSHEYTDKMLYDDMIGGLPAYPDWTNANGGDAHYSIDCDHYACSGSKMKYRFVLCSEDNSVKDQDYLLKWSQTTTYPTNSCACFPNTTNQPPETDWLQQVVHSDGDPHIKYVELPEVEVPGSPCTITESSATVTPIPKGGGGGGGPGGGGPGGGGPSPKPG
jgi:hypothetical protein